MATTINDIIERFKRKYDYFTFDEVDEIYKQALSDCLMLKFPNENLSELPDGYTQEIEWIYKRMVEIVELQGVSSFVAYSENGMSVNLDNTYISNGLRSLIRPKVCTRGK